MSIERPQNSPIGEKELKELKDKVNKLAQDAPRQPWAPTAERRVLAFGGQDDPKVMILRSPETGHTTISVHQFKENTPTGGQIYSNKEITLSPDRARYKEEEDVYAANGERILPQEEQDTTPLLEQFKRRREKDQAEKKLGLDQVTYTVYEDFKRILDGIHPTDTI